MLSMHRNQTWAGDMPRHRAQIGPSRAAGSDALSVQMPGQRVASPTLAEFLISPRGQTFLAGDVDSPFAHPIKAVDSSS
jgi:hypothetical protein